MFKRFIAIASILAVTFLTSCSTYNNTETLYIDADQTMVTIETENKYVPNSAWETAETTVSSASVSEETTVSSNTTKAETTVSSGVSDNKPMYVHFIDVGQGDSIFIELPNQQTMLIDAGEKDQAQKIITYIHEQGYENLDYVVATHPHSDHIGGMADVIDNFKVSNVYLSPTAHTTKTYENMLIAITNSKANVSMPRAGDSILSSNNVSIEVVAPKEANADELNNESIVIKLTYGDTRFVFAGDAEKSEEDSMWTNIKCDVLKIGHHGSDSSTTANFLKKTEPRYAVISVGTGNKYNHPTDDVLKRLTTNNIEIFRTDKQGTIVFSSDGTTVSANAKPTSYEATTVSRQTESSQADATVGKYVINTNSSPMKIHYATCSSVKQMNDKNKLYTDDYDAAIADGCVPCKKCNPK